ncbi:Transcription factor Dp-2, partial [Podila verticillata]
MTPDEHYPSSETSTHLHPYSNNNNGSTATGNHNNNHNITPNKNNNYNNNNNNNNNSSSSSNSNIKSEARPFMILANDLDRSPRIAPPPIRTKWSDDLKKREYPLTFSSSTQSSNSDRPSPSTPRSLLPLLPPLDPSLLPSSTSLHPPHRSYFAGPFDSPSKASFHRHHILPTPMYFSESPMEYRSTPLVTPPLAPPPQLQPPLQQQQQQQPQPQHHHQYQHYNHRLHEQPYLEEHDMEHCSEQDDVREREYGEDDEDEDDDDKELELRRQQHRVAQQQQHQQQQQLRYPTPNEQVQHHGEEEEGEDEEEDARSKQAKKKRPNARTHHSQSSVSSVVSDQALGVHTLRQEGKEDVKASLSKASPSPSSRQVSTKAKASTSVQGTLENVLDQIEDDNQGHDGSGVHSQAGRGLRFYSQRVCDRVQAKGATTYNELVHEVSGGQPGEYVEDAVGQEPSGQENIRRRVYDALNVLEALDIISMDKKEIQWIGVENSRVLNETTRKVGTTSQGNNHRRELDEESEEPEDDDMDIEQLQREVDALKLRNELERAQLQDQVSRHVQLNNLVARNKLREAKEQERHERRKQRKLKREEERARGNADANNDECNPDHMEPTTSEEKKKKSERRHRHRSPRHREIEAGEQGEEDEEEDMEEGEDPGETKEERRARKQARRERREKRALRREQRDSGIMLTEEEKIQMPFVVVRIPRYGHQSSDSEANISVVRRSRESRSKKSGKTKRQEDTTTVEIQIPQQEELCIISDTEILGDLGLGTVSLNDLKTMLPKDLLGNARYVTNPGNVTVHGGFERV